MFYDSVNISQSYTGGGQKVEITLPKVHRKLQQVLRDHGCEMVTYPSMRHTISYRTPTLTPELMQDIFKYWPHVHFSIVHNPLFIAVPVYSTYTFLKPELLNIVRVVNTTCQSLMITNDRAEERFEALDDEITRGLGYFLTKGTYDELHRVYQSTGHTRFIKAVKDRLESAVAERVGNKVIIPLTEAIKTAIGAGLYTHGKFFGDNFCLDESSFQICVLAAIIDVDPNAVIEGDNLIVEYGQWYIERPHVPGELRTDKFSVPAASWILIRQDDKDRIAHISFVGGTQQVRRGAAVVTSPLKRGIMLMNPGRGYYNRDLVYRMEGTYKQYTNDAELPESGVVHLSMDCEMIYDPQPNKNFIHMSGNGIGATYNRKIFTAQLKRALLLPFDEEWIPRMWELGLERRVIREMNALGCSAWLVLAGSMDHWALIIAELTTGQKIKPKDMKMVVEGELNVTADDDAIAENEESTDDDDEEVY